MWGGPARRRLSRRRPTLPSSHPLSTMGAGGGHGRVRDGNGWDPSAIATGTLSRTWPGAPAARRPCTAASAGDAGTGHGRRGTGTARRARTGPGEREGAGHLDPREPGDALRPTPPAGPGGRSRFRPIRTRPLSVLPRVHSGPINLVFYQGSSLRRGRRPNLGEGFALRCFQRLSRPDTATQRCPWQDSWYTGGRSTPVLSY